MTDTAAQPPDAQAAATTAPADSSSPAWENLDDATLLKWRVCELKVSIEGSPLAARITQLYEELHARGLQFRPPCYLATEWLCPDGVPAIGIPFYLVHSRLVRLEKTMMLEAEGADEKECMKLLRHEAGHAFNYAYKLYRRTRWRELFGSMTADYEPHEYYMRPYSRQYVVHLEDNYAQAHPDEDFAETFAVWLTPGLDWRARYAEWGALKKLEYVDHLMRQIAQHRPLVASGPRRWAAKNTRATLDKHYRQKRKEFATAYPGFYDKALHRLFTTDAGDQVSAARFLSRNRRKLVDTIALWARVPKYVADNIIRRLGARARELGLRLRGPEQDHLLPAGICIASFVLEARERYLRTVKRESKP